jgi:peptide/nickel transport system permease protein
VRPVSAFSGGRWSSGAPGRLTNYLCRRFGHGLLVLAGVSVLTFALTALAPGDVLSEVKVDPQISPETVAALRARYGLDRPLPLKFLHWLQSVRNGELGFSLTYNRPVAALLWPRARNTLLLTTTASALAWLIAVPVGAWSASQRGRWGDRLCAGATTSLLVVPELVVGLGLLLFAARTGFFPIGGMVSARFDELGAWDRLEDVSDHLVLPVMALILLILPVLVRHVRSSFVEVLAAPFIQAARARGVPDRRILFHHALRVAANPLTALFGLSIAGLLSTSLVVEALMSWPGLGPLLLEAIVARDLHLVIGAVMCSTVLLLTGNLIADALLYLADPRTRADNP